jgi:hypothetical protein
VAVVGPTRTSTIRSVVDLLTPFGPRNPVTARGNPLDGEPSWHGEDVQTARNAADQYALLRRDQAWPRLPGVLDAETGADYDLGLAARKAKPCHDWDAASKEGG